MPAIRPHQKTRLHLRDSATVDFGPEGATLTENGTVSVADDVLTFPGSASDYIDAVQAATDTSTTVYSISGWFNADSIGVAFQTVVVHATGGGSPPMLIRLTTSSTLQFSHSGVSVSSSTVSASQWYHFAAVWDGSNIELFLNGVSQGTTAYSTATTLGTAWEIGNWTINSTHYAGKLADLRFNNYAMTAGEVFDLYNEGRGFDLPERRQLPDTVVHLLDGSTDAGFYGEETTLDSVAYENGVYTFSGTTPHIDFGQTRVLNEADGFALSCFFNAPDMSTRRFLWCHGTTTYVELNGAGSVRYKASDNVLRSRAFAFTAGQTYHLAISIEGGVASVYIDGVLDGTFATAGTSTFSFSQFSTSSSSYEYLGDMWDNRVFDRPISAGEVANLYRKGIPSIRRAEVLRIDPARYSGSGDLIDQTGGGNDLSLPSGYSVTGDVIVSDGTADGPNTGVSLASSEGTIAFWINTTDTKWDGVYSTNAAYALAAQDGNSSIATGGLSNPVIYVDGVAIANTRQALYDATSDGTWHHVAITADFGGGFSSIRLFQYNAQSSSWLNGQVDKLLIANTKYTADQIAFLASSREFADPFPVPFGNLGGEVLNWQASRYTGSGDLLDQSGNGNALTIPAGYTVTDGVLVGDGSTSSLSTGLSVTSDAISVGAWVRTTDDRAILMESGGKFFGCFQDGSSSATRNGAMTNAQLYVDGVAGTFTRDELHTAIADGQWHHMAFTADLGGVWANLTFWDFNANASYRLDGETDDLRIETGRKWSAEEIKLLASARGVELPNTRDAKLAVLPSYDDASNGSTSTIDYSGNLNTGTISGGPTWNTTDNSESGTRSIESTGAGSVSFDDSGLPLGDSARSIVTWVRVDDYSNDTQWFEYGTDATGQRFGLGVRNTDWMVVTINGAAVGTQNTPAAGTWAPVIVTYAGDGAAIDTVTFYIDGVAYSASTQAGTGSNVPGTVSGTGALLASIVSGNIEAAIDDVLVYDRVLTPGEITRFSERRNIFGDAYIPPAPGSGGLIPIILF